MEHDVSFRVDFNFYLSTRLCVKSSVLLQRANFIFNFTDVFSDANVLAMTGTAFANSRWDDVYLIPFVNNGYSGKTKITIFKLYS